MRRLCSLLAVLLLLAACTTAAPSGEVTPTPSARIGATTTTGPIAGGGGNAGGGSPAVIRAFSDTRILDTKAIQQGLDLLAGTACKLPAGDDGPLSVNDALKNARASLDKMAPGAMAKLDAATSITTANGWRTAAAAESGQGHIAAGLAALLEAIRLDQKDSRTLVNAAGLMPTLGLAREALAFTSEANRLGIAQGNAMGIDPHAASLNNIGNAYLALHQWDKAKTALQQALQIQPNFSEAESNLAIAALCSGDRAGAAKFFRLGAYRQPLDLLDYGDSEQPKPDQALDLSAASDGTLPVLKYATSVEEGIQLEPYYRGWLDLFAQRQTAHNNRRTELGPKVAAAKPSALTQQRTFELTSMLYHLAAPGGPAYSLSQEIDKVVQEATDVWDSVYGPSGALDKAAMDCAGADFNSCFVPRCQSAMTSGHGRYLQALDRLDRATREYHKLHHRYATGIATQIGNPVQHELVMLDIADHDDTLWSTLANIAERLSRFEQIDAPLCGYGQGSLESTPQKADDEQDPGGCPKNLQDTKMGVKLGPLSITANCEEVEFELETEGILGIFVQLTVEEGEVSVFAGPKASTPTGDVLPFSVSSKDGFYISAGSDGVKDFGWAVEPIQATAELGGHQLSVDGDKMNFSFVGISAYLPLVGTQ